MRDTEHTKGDSGVGLTVSAETVLSCAAYAVSQGLSLERITRATGLTVAAMSRPDARLPMEMMAALWRLLDEALPGQALALDLARLAPLSAMGRVSQIAQYAGDLRAALQVFARYAHTVIQGLEITLREQGGETGLFMHHPLDALDRGHGAELALGLGLRVISENFGQGVRPIRVEFVHAPHGPLSAYEEYFGAPVYFGCGHNGMVFTAEHLEATNEHYKPEIFRFLQAHLALSSGRSPEREDPLGRVRAALARNGQRGEYGAAALAKVLGLSLRQLQRLVAAQGTTVHALVDEAREARARDLLSVKELGIGEVAFLLGYSNDRAFRRAFKRWTGQAPGLIRSP